MAELTHKPSIPTPDKEYKELQAMWQRMADRTYDDKIRIINESNNV